MDQNREDPISAAEIIAKLEEQTEDRRPLFRMLASQAPPLALIGALRAASKPFTRQLLCDLLGEVRAPESIEVLVDALDDQNSTVRASAADALGKVFGYVQDPPGKPETDLVLEALLRLWAVEKSDDVRSTVMQTLALLGDPSVKSVLEGALGDPDDRVRRQAAWGLNYLARVAP